MPATYQHTQVGRVTIAAVGLAILVAALGAIVTRDSTPLIVAGGLLVVLSQSELAGDLEEGREAYPPGGSALGHQ